MKTPTKKIKKYKTVKGWAVVNANGTLAFYDNDTRNHRHVYMQKRTAKSYVYDARKVVPCIIKYQIPLK